MSNMIIEAAPIDDKRTVTVNGRKYWAGTNTKCTTCSIPGRFMMVKQKIQNDLMLECAWCDTVYGVKADSVMLTEGAVDMLQPVPWKVD